MKFISDEIYTKLTGEYSVHTSYLPEVDEERIDEQVEERMDLVRTLVTLGRGTREKEKIKVRQPLSEILVDGKYRERIEDLVPLIQEELNVKNVVFAEDLDTYMNFSLKPNFKEAGPVLGGKIKAFGQALAQADPKTFVSELEANEKAILVLDGEETEITKDLVDVRISAKEGFAVAMENNVFTILDTTLTDELINEGYARELVSKVQQLRKQADFDMMDRINIYVDAGDEIKKAIAMHDAYIKEETLADAIIDTGELDTFDLNGHKTGIKVEKI